MSSNVTGAAGGASCPFDVSSIPAIIVLIKNGTIRGEPGYSNNFDLIVKECPSICMTLVGTGNPDLTGIGLFIHYIIQAVLTAILLGVPFLFSHLLTSHPKLSDVVSKFRRTFLEFNAYAVLAIIVSCFVRFFQYASAYELTVVQAIVNFEAFIILVCLFYYPATDWSDLDDADAPWSKEIVHLVFFLLAAIANVVMGTSLTTTNSHANDSKSMRSIYLSMFGLLEPCSWVVRSQNFGPAGDQLKIQGFDVFSIFVPIFAFGYLFCRFISRKQIVKRLTQSTLWRRLPVMPPQIWAIPKWMFAFTISFDLGKLGPFVATEWTVIVSILLWLFFYMAQDTGDSHGPEIWFKRCRQCCETCWNWLCHFKFLSWLEKPQYLWPVLWLWPVTFFCGLNPAEKLIAIQNYRRALADVLDNNSPENYWGVGQVAALLAWLPLLVEAAAEAVRFYTSRKRKRTANTSLQTKTTSHATSSPSLTAQSTDVYLQGMSLNLPASPPPTSSQYCPQGTPPDSATIAVTHDPSRSSARAPTQDEPTYTICRTGTASSTSLPDADQRFKLHKRPTLAIEEGIRDA